MSPLAVTLSVYLIAVSLLAAILTVSDKRRARTHRWRIREATLWSVAALGGAAVMLLTMRLIRHKTRHTSFMVGLPLLTVLHIGLICLLWPLLRY